MIVDLVKRWRAEELRHPGVGVDDLAFLGVEVCSQVMMAVAQRLGLGRQTVNRKVGRKIVWKRTSEQDDMIMINVDTVSSTAEWFLLPGCRHGHM